MSKFYRTILDTLQGRTAALQGIPAERLDWAGPGAVLEMYRKTSGKDRIELVRAFGQVIQKHPVSPAVIAQLIQIASSLDLAEVEPQIRELQADPFAEQEPLKRAITNYLAFRQLNTRSDPVTFPRTAKRKSKTLHVRAARANRPEPANVNPFSHRKSASG